jgi:cytidine deaminase
VTRGPRRAYAGDRALVAISLARFAPRTASAPLDATQTRALVAAAKRVRARAYAPYSRFAVGAAVLDERGRVHSGCNVENASYGLTVCAERNAIAVAIAAGAHRIIAVAVVTASSPPSAPCGACRQVMAEVAGDETPILLAPAKGQATTLRCRLGDLLPRAFRLK